MRHVERDVMLKIVDTQWKDHLYSLDHLKEGIGLRGYGQKDPLVEYKKESFELFQDMKRRIDEDMVSRLWIWTVYRRSRRCSRAPAAAAPGGDAVHAERAEQLSRSARSRQRRAPPRRRSVWRAAGGGQSRTPARTGGDDAPVHTVRRDEPKVGRNDPCPCGSGKKYKKCHGAAA